MKDLPKAKQKLLFEMIEGLSQIKGIEAIALGGSYARGCATEESDLDIGLYYLEKTPPDIEAIQNLARQFDDSKNPIVTRFYEWGPWVNGGAWLQTKAGEVDWLYRNLDQVQRVLAEAHQGRFSWDFRQQPPYGYFSVTYLADIQHNKVLYDPKDIFTPLKKAISVYPEALRKAIIQEHLWGVEFAYFNAQKLAKRGCIYGTVGCMTRIAAELTQVLFAMNSMYSATEKGALETIESFKIKPKEYASRMQDILSSPGRDQTLKESLKKLQEVIKEVMQLAHPIYVPRYSLE
jgi:predicted nucleotidyltransferase